MASTIKIKNSSTAGAVPTSGDLVQGELAINVTDRRIYTENASGTVVELGTPSIDDNGNATAITIDSSENVGIGTSSPAYKMDVRTSGDAVQMFATNGTVQQAVGYCSGGLALFGSITNHPIAFITNNTERARIDSSGNLLAGTTSNQANGKIQSVFDGSAVLGMNIIDTSATATATAISFIKNAGTRGSITVTASATAYVTSSDYRLKENIAPMSDALSVVQQLKPCTYNWKVDGSTGQGFIAHELQAVVPDCVIGEKDAVDAEGNPKYQGIDTSFLVATLTAAIQELKSINDTQAQAIATLTERIAALEAK